MFNLKGKKLLVLGGTRLSGEIVRQAQELGIYVIVTDYLEDSPAKKIANESRMVSTTDVDAVARLIQNEKIDGVLTGFIESMLPYYQQICEKTGLPCYATAEQIDIATNKLRFKKICRDFNVPVVDEFTIKPSNMATSAEKIKYPVLIKPVDNTAGRGISICNSSDAFADNYKRALDFSPGKQVIVERYMSAKEVTIFYTIQNGNIILTAMADRHTKFVQDGTIPLPVAYIFPSGHLGKYIKSLDEKVKNMLRFIGIKDGLVFIQSFVENGQCIFYEMGFRLTSTMEYYILSRTNGLNILELMINFALTGKMSDRDLSLNTNPDFKQYGCNITFLAKPGKIGKIVGTSEICELPEVIALNLSYYENEEIPETAVGTLIQVMARVFAIAQTRQDLFNVMNKIHASFKVFSESGENMLLPTFNTMEILEGEHC